MNLLNNYNRIVNFILHFHKLTWSQFIPFKQGEVWRSRFFVYSRVNRFRSYSTCYSHYFTLRSLSYVYIAW